MNDREKLIYLLEPIMSGLACEHESSSCEMMDCRMCQAIHLADHLIANNVVVLPCPVGTMVYQIRNTKVDDLYGGASYHYELGVRRAIFDVDLIYQFGKTVFLTEEEAKEKLKEMEVAKSER